MIYIIAIFISLFATITGSITGIGGGVIIKPVLEAFSGFSLVVVSFLSGCTVLAMTLVSLIRNRKSTIKIDYKKSTWLAAGATIGGIAGKGIFDLAIHFSEHDSVLGIIQSSLLIVITAGVVVYVQVKEHITLHHVKHPAACIAIGFLLGMISSFLGIGGGPINIAVLSFFFAMDSKTSALNSIYIIFFSQLTSFGTTAVNGTIPQVDILVLLMMIVGGISGSIIGSIISNKMTNRKVDGLFSTVMVIIIGISFYNLISYV